MFIGEALIENTDINISLVKDFPSDIALALFRQTRQPE
jgi:hypothetical protein